MADYFSSLPPMPQIDHGVFGEVSVKALPKNQFIGGKLLTRNALAIPHVTHHDSIDITLVDSKRRAWNTRFSEAKLTLLPLLIKAMVGALRSYPVFNSSLDDSGENVVLKHYYNIGIAIDTDKGLVVGVVNGCDRLSVGEIAEQATQLSSKARARGLSLGEMSGGGITISSLGDLGGTGFTPIINAPEVAIIGVSRAEYRQCFEPGKDPVLKYMLPLSLSYDHRVINGADAGKFMRALQQELNSDSLLELIKTD